MLRTWTDTHYKLGQEDGLYIATHEEQGSASLVCPARDGAGFSIHFTPDHTKILVQLITVLQGLKTQQTAVPFYENSPIKTHIIR